jgi:hypothetical protein
MAETKDEELNLIELRWLYCDVWVLIASLSHSAMDDPRRIGAPNVGYLAPNIGYDGDQMVGKELRKLRKK